MAQQREFVALAEDSGSLPITHMAGDKLFVTPGAGEPGPLCPLPHRHCMPLMHKHTSRQNTQTHKIKLILKIINKDLREILITGGSLSQ